MTSHSHAGWTILLIFGACAVFDFIWGYVRGRSIPAGIISLFGGLFGTAVYLLIFWPPRGKDEPPH